MKLVSATGRSLATEDTLPASGVLAELPPAPSCTPPRYRPTLSVGHVRSVGLSRAIETALFERISLPYAGDGQRNRSLDI